MTTWGFDSFEIDFYAMTTSLNTDLYTENGEWEIMSSSISNHSRSVSDNYNTFVSVFTIKRHKGASAARARGLLMVKTVNKYTLNSLVSDLFCNRQRM